MFLFKLLGFLFGGILKLVVCCVIFVWGFGTAQEHAPELAASIAEITIGEIAKTLKEQADYLEYRLERSETYQAAKRELATEQEVPSHSI